MTFAIGDTMPQRSAPAAVAAVRAEQLDEPSAFALLSSRKPLRLRADTKTAAHSTARLHFWVGLEGQVEAVELSCGDQELFDEMVDAVLEWSFRRKDFVTDLSFVRRGRRVWLLLELPPARRPKGGVCAGEQASRPLPAGKGLVLPVL